jgi:hypothetical protein
MTSSPIEAVKAPFRPFRHGAVAIGRKLLLDRLFSGGEFPRILVISTGGAGTTFLMKHLARFVPLNDPFDGDRVKHLPRLPAGWLQDRRILYIHGAPADVYRSIRRRGWVHMHAGELGCLACQFTWGDLWRRLFERAVQRQIDTFHAYRSDTVTLLAYDDIWSRVDEIAAFFGIEAARFKAEFPTRRPRKSERT